MAHFVLHVKLQVSLWTCYILGAPMRRACGNGANPTSLIVHSP